MKDKNIIEQINEGSKISVTTNRDRSDYDNTSSDITNNMVILVMAYLKV